MLRGKMRDQARLLPITHYNEEGEQEDLDLPAGPEYDPVQIVRQAERAAELRAALGRMEAACREGLRQFYFEGLSYKAMAARQGVSINTVGSRLSRCLDKLRSGMGRDGVAGSDI